MLHCLAFTGSHDIEASQQKSDFPIKKLLNTNHRK